MGGLFSSKSQPTIPQARTSYQQPASTLNTYYGQRASYPTTYSTQNASYSTTYSAQQRSNAFEYVPRNIPSVRQHQHSIQPFLEAKRILRTTALLPKLMMNHNHSTITSTSLVSYTSEYQKIQYLFRHTGKSFMRLKSILKVNNPYLEALYELKKLELASTYRGLEEVQLFHGTPSINVKNINNANLNYRFHGKGVGCKFGNGISFAPFSYYASHYCSKNSKDKQMYLCRVLKGKAHVGWKGCLLPMEGHDTTIKEGEHVVVKFHDDVYYPAYVLNFEQDQ